MLINISPTVKIKLDDVVALEESDGKTLVYIEGISQPFTTDLPMNLLADFIDMQKEREDPKEDKIDRVMNILLKTTQTQV